MHAAALPKYGEFVRVHCRANEICVNVVRDLNSYIRVVSLRSIVYMGEQLCPFDEEFDGCDLSGVTHLIAECDAAPVGTLRLRWFADFVKIERVAVLRDKRNGHIVKALMAHAIEISRRRGYGRALGYVQARLEPFWRTLGFRVRPGREPFTFSDHEYVEVEGLLEPHGSPITIDSPPLVLLRPDGAWDVAGVLDRSAEREATNPHA